MDIDSLTTTELEQAIARLESAKRERDAERYERLKTVGGAEFVAEAMRPGGWLSWMRGLKIQRENRYQGGEPTIELRPEKADSSERIPGIVPVEFEDLTQLIDKTAKPRHFWIQPRKDDPSKIEESWFVSSNGIIALCDN